MYAMNLQKYSHMLMRCLSVAASLPLGRPKETVSTRHGSNNITSKQLVSS